MIIMQNNKIMASSNDEVHNTKSGKSAVSLNIKNLTYSSYSTIKPSFPFIIGYPSFNSNSIGLDLGYAFSTKKLNHNFSFNAILPSSIKSDNGTGINFLINSPASTYSRIEARYNFFDDLYNLYNIHLKYGFTSSVLYENRKLVFLSDDITRQSDINFGIGPVLGMEVPLWKVLKVKAEGHFLIFLPYTCYGIHTFENAESEIRKDSYYPISYKSLWHLFLEGEVTSFLSLNAGYRRTNQIGYGNSKNSILLNEIVTSKMDRLNEAFIGIIYYIN